MPIYPYSFQLPPLNVQDIPNDGAPGEFLGINVGGALDWLPAGGGGSGDMLAANNLSELTNFATARTNIGLGTASTPTFANLTLTSPSLSSSAPVTISQTWGTTGIYTAFKVVATETAVASTVSNLLELWSGSTPTLKVNADKSGNFAVTGTILADSNRSAFRDGGVTIGNAGALQWSQSSTAGATRDLFLVRDAPNTLALRNGTAAQTFRVYNTYTDASNYERGFMRWGSSILQIGAEGAGSGANRTVGIYINGSNYFGVGSIQSPIWNVVGAGHLQSGTDNTYDIGASGANRPRNVYVANGLTTGSISPNSGTDLIFNGASTGAAWKITPSGHFHAFADNAYDIGASGANRPRNLYVGSNIYAAGNVGIGTTAPGAKLEVVGGSSDILVLKNAAQSVLSVTSTGGAGSVAFNHANSPNLVINQSTGNKITLGVGSNNLHASNSSNVPIDLILQGSGGNVGIGTTSPTSKLHVVGDAFLAANGSNTAPSLRIGAGAYVNGWYSFGGLQLNGVVNSLNMFGITLAGTNISAGHLSFGSGDAVFERDGEQDHIAMRRGALGQKFSVYGTYPGANWERFTITAPTSGNVLLGTYKGTGGVARGLEFQTDGVTRLTIQATTGAASFSSDITPGANRYIRFINNTAIHTTDVGVLNVLDVGGFNVNARITLGGSTSSFPALKRSTTSLQARLADDSAFTNIQGKLTTDTAFDATVVTPTGFITLYDSTGTAYKVPCVPA